jgi:hypothetical protein
MRTPIELLTDSVGRLERRLGALESNALAGRRDLADQFRYECLADCATLRRAFAQISAACAAPVAEGAAS